MRAVAKAERLSAGAAALSIPGEIASQELNNAHLIMKGEMILKFRLNKNNNIEKLSGGGYGD